MAAASEEEGLESVSDLAATQNENDPDVWKNRRILLVGDDFAQQLQIVGRLAQQYPNDYLIWDHRRCIIEKMGSELPTAIIDEELEFTKNIISKGVTNLQAWSHREWIIRKFDNSLWQKEIEYCKEILDVDTFNVSAWDQICRAAWFYPSKKKKELRDREAQYAKRAIYDQPGNEGPWLYLKFLYVGDKKCLFKDPYLECIYVDLLTEEADRIKSVLMFNPPRHSLTYSLVDSRGCLNALNLILDLMYLGYKADANTKLVEAVDILLDNLVWSFSHVTPSRILDGSEFYRNICALVLSLDACRIRYNYMYRGYSIFEYCNYQEEVNEHRHNSRDYEEQMNEHMHNSRGVIAKDICPDTSPQQPEDLFKEWVTSNDYDRLRPEWKEHLLETYLKRRKRYDRLDCDTLEDLKWDVRRLVLQDHSSDGAALEELNFTTKIIKRDAYNRLAWSHRHWVFQTFGESWDDDKVELEFCSTIIAKNPYNSFAWDQRYYVMTRWVPRTYSTMPEKGSDDSVVFKDCVKYVEERIAEEIEFTLTAIKANADNKILWGHISGLYNAYSDSIKSSMFTGSLGLSLIRTILHVLEEAKVSSRFDDKCSIMVGDGSYSVDNARGILNALNSLCDLFFNCGCSICKWDYLMPDLVEKGIKKRFEDVLTQMCPDSCSCFSNFQKEWPICYVDRIEAIVRAVEVELTDCRVIWKNASDELIRKYCYFSLV